MRNLFIYVSFFILLNAQQIRAQEKRLLPILILKQYEKPNLKNSSFTKFKENIHRLPCSLPGMRNIAAADELMPIKEQLPQYQENSTQEMFKKIAPTSISETDTGDMVLRQIADRGLIYWTKTSSFKNSYLGVITEETEKRVKADMLLSTQSTNHEIIYHRLFGQLLVLQGSIFLGYSGYFNAEVISSPQSENYKVKVSPLHSKYENFFLQQRHEDSETINEIGLAYNF